jgi:protein TonB
VRSASAILFPALLAASALGHAVLVHTRILPAKPAELVLPPAETTEIFLIEEPPPPDPVPTPEPTPEPLPPEPEPKPIPQEIVTAEQSPEVAELPPEPTPTPPPAPTPKPTPRPVSQTPKPQPAAIVSRSGPVVIQNTPPHYPDLARRKGWEGRAIIRVEVSAEGRPVSTSIAKSSGYGILDQAALRAVKSWRFQPRAISGIPAAGTVEVPVNFSLNR